jgi:hypothetical protein
LHLCAFDLGDVVRELDYDILIEWCELAFCFLEAFEQSVVPGSLFDELRVEPEFLPVTDVVPEGCFLTVPGCARELVFVEYCVEFFES